MLLVLSCTLTIHTAIKVITSLFNSSHHLLPKAQTGNQPVRHLYFHMIPLCPASQPQAHTAKQPEVSQDACFLMHAPPPATFIHRLNPYPGLPPDLELNGNSSSKPCLTPPRRRPLECILLEPCQIPFIRLVHHPPSAKGSQLPPSQRESLLGESAAAND